MPFFLESRRDVGVALGAAVVGQFANGLGPVAQKVLLDDVIIARTRAAEPWLLVLAALAGITFAMAYVRRWVGGRVALSVQHRLRNAIFERLMRLDFAGHDQLRTGQLVSRSSGDLGLIQQLLATLPLVLGNLVLLVVSLAAMLWLSPQLTLVTAVILPLMVLASLRLRGTVFPATWDAQQRAGDVAGVVDEAVSGVRIVKGFAAEEREVERLGRAARSLYAARVRMLQLQARSTSTLAALPAIGQVAVLAVGGWLAIHGRLSLGTFLAFSSYLVQLVAPLRMMAMLVAALQQARAGATRVLDILDANAEVVDRPGAREAGAVQGELRFEQVRFGYERSHPVLDGFDLTVRPGEVVALVGASGSGKSTVAALAPRFYDVSAGRIMLDGVDIRDLTLRSLRSKVGVAFEDPFVFSDTVRANIAYAHPEAGDDEVRRAARIAGAEEFIEALPEGFDTMVGERGLTLSGGQRQRIALARAIVSDPRVLVLDAATSAIDTATEEAIHRALAVVLNGRTTLLIAHQASTVRLADRVVLVEHGRVVDAGTHDELTARSPTYRALLSEDTLEPPLEPAKRSGAGETDTVSEPVIRHEPPLEPRKRSGRGETDTVSEPVIRPEVTPPTPLSIRPERAPPARGHGVTMQTNLTPTPQLLAALERLPPADDDPRVDVADAAAEPPEVFRLRQFVRPWRSSLALGLLLVATDAVLTVAGPVLIRHGIDHGVTKGSDRVLWITSAVYALVTLVDWGAMWAGAALTGRTAERMLFALRIRLFAHLQRLSLDYFDAEMDGRIMTRMTSDVEALSQLVQTGLISAVVGVATCVGVMVALVVLSPPLALAAASVLVPLVAATLWYRRYSSVAYGQAREAIAMVNANLQENLSGVRITQASGREARNLVDFGVVSGRYLRARLRSQRLLAVYFPGIGFLADLAAIAVLAEGARLVGSGATTPSVVIAFLLFLNLFFAPIQQLSQVFDTWQQAAVSSAKITELLTTESTTPLPLHPIRPGRLRGTLRFEGVRFRYPGAASDALDGVDLTIEAGETVALVGATGAGKSTIVRLAARFADPSAGVVSVDDISLRDIDLTEYRRQLGIVPQEAFLFTGTVRDNIAYGRADATDAQVEAAARAVGADRMVASLPDGYRTEITERGRSLSAGQRQLIALARAELVDPVIVLLDEATASLDLPSERLVRGAMAAASQRRTTLLVAHRLATARAADRIVVMDSGRVAEIGTHHDLLAADGLYARLWEAGGGRAPDFETTDIETVVQR